MNTVKTKEEIIQYWSGVYAAGLCDLKTAVKSAIEEYNPGFMPPAPARRAERVNVFFIDEIRKQINDFLAEEISISKFVEFLNDKATGSDAIERYKLMEEYRQQGQPATGIQWVDYSIAPKYTGRDYYCEIDFGTGKMIKREVFLSKKGTWLTEGRVIKWLDESGAASQPTDADEKEAMMQGFDRIRKAFGLRSWLMEGRGSYPYDDDGYKEEVRHLYDEVEYIINDTWRQIKSKSFEYREKVIAEYKASLPAFPTEEHIKKYIDYEGLSTVAYRYRPHPFRGADYNIAELIKGFIKWYASQLSNNQNK